MDRYDRISNAAGLKLDYGRMRVAGFKHTGEKELKKYERFDKISSDESNMRNMSNGMRTSPRHVLAEAEIKAIKQDADAIDVPVSVLRFNEGDQTGYSDRYGVIYVRGDVLPDKNSHLLRDRMNQKCVLAHEYYGHYVTAPSPFRVGEWRDEFKASYRAALDTPNLTDDERRDLMLDAYDRAKEAGATVKYNKNARMLIYGNE